MQCSVEITGDIQKELSSGHKKFSITLFVLGLLGVFAYFALKMFYYELWVEIVFCVSIVVLILGILMYAGYNTAKKKIKGANVINHYEFSPTSMVVSHERNEEIESTIKILYKNIKKIKETKHYLFLFISRKVVLPVAKSELEAEDVSTIKVWINSEKMNKSKRLDLFKNSANKDTKKELSPQEIRNQALLQEKQKKMAEKLRLQQEKEEQKRLEQERKTQEKLMKLSMDKEREDKKRLEKERKQKEMLLKRRRK